MAKQTPTYIFPASDQQALGVAMATRMREMLLNGSVPDNQPGLLTTPKFINRSGAGTGRDRTLETGAEVVFAFDNSALPHVRILGIKPDEPRYEWGDSQYLHRCTVSIDCFANAFNPGAATPDITARNIDAILGGFVLDLMSNYEAMTRWGFTFPTTLSEQAPGLMTKSGEPFEFHFPITCSFEAYQYKNET